MGVVSRRFGKYREVGIDGLLWGSKRGKCGASRISGTIRGSRYSNQQQQQCLSCSFSFSNSEPMADFILFPYNYFQLMNEQTSQVLLLEGRFNCQWKNPPELFSSVTNNKQIFQSMDTLSCWVSCLTLRRIPSQSPMNMQCEEVMSCALSY